MTKRFVTPAGVAVTTNSVAAASVGFTPQVDRKPAKKSGEKKPAKKQA